MKRIIKHSISFAVWTACFTFALAPFARGDELTDAINAERTAHGLRALAHEPTLVAWASQNNEQQMFRGMGHWVLGTATRQNAAWGQQSIAQVVREWMYSPGHRAAILAWDVTHCGGSFDGLNWTWNAAAFQPTPPGPTVSRSDFIAAGSGGVQTKPAPAGKVGVTPPACSGAACPKPAGHGPLPPKAHLSGCGAEGGQCSPRPAACSNVVPCQPKERGCAGGRRCGFHPFRRLFRGCR